MKALQVKPIKVPSSYIHPPPPNEALPRHEFTLGLIGKFLLFFFVFVIPVCVLFSSTPTKIGCFVVCFVSIDMIYKW